ncbi:MAG TPA: hypothetical protein VJK30_00055 [Coxiellaceae bacterium]|nr:MAG: hypothetical protein A3E81_00050 [Gammaproteobacteria bacterium RIFCSPHIGHO2_12_FULL_36_30]HLB55708.1 hypothetical protein [Coxiellaceae bacterium]
MKKLIWFAMLLGCYSLSAFAVSCEYYDFHYDTSSGKSYFTYNLRTNNYEHPRTFIINSSHADEKNIPAEELLGFRSIVTSPKGTMLTSCFHGVHGEVLYDDVGNMTCPKLIPSAPDKDGHCQFSLPSSQI